MAVHKSRVSRSKRDMRRSHDALTAATLSLDPVTHECHRRHHIAASGFYRGKKVIQVAIKVREEEKSEGPG